MKRSMHHHRGVILMLLSAVMALLAAPAYGQIGNRDITDANLNDAERRETTLLWLNTFLSESDLLRKEDMDKIRQAVAQMSPSQLRQWLEQTKQLRQYVEGEKWQGTKQWLREFMRVQAIYSSQELQKLRTQIVQADANQMLAILKRIQAKHDALIWMHQAAERNRQVEVDERDAYIAQQAAAAQAARGVSSPNAPLYGGGMSGGSGQKPSKGYYVPSPLINSRELARVAVWSELWGPGLLIGF